MLSPVEQRFLRLYCAGVYGTAIALAGKPDTDERGGWGPNIPIWDAGELYRDWSGEEPHGPAIDACRKAVDDLESKVGPDMRAGEPMPQLKPGTHRVVFTIEEMEA